MRIHSGDTVELETCSGNPDRLLAMGVPAGQIPEALREIYAKVTNKGTGGHILTGPIYVEKAEPGDVLVGPEAYGGTIRTGRGFAAASVFREHGRGSAGGQWPD